MSRAPGNARGRWWTALAWPLILAPALPVALRLPEFGRLQRNDYFAVMASFREWSFPLIESNEHTIALPALVWWANLLATDGDNRGLSLFALAALALIVVCLVRVLPEPVRARQGARVLSGAAICAVVFTPAAAHSMVMGFSGSIWFLSNALSVAAIAALCTAHENRRVVLALALGGLGLFAYSTNLSLWPALWIGGWLIGCRRSEWIALALAGALAIAIYAGLFQGVSRSPDPNTSDPASVLLYTATYLGGLLSGSVPAATWAGFVGLAVALGSASALFAGSDAARRRRMAPWLMLTVYGLGNALGTGIGRSRLGVEHALQSRYCSVSGLFWIGATALLAGALFSSRRNRDTFEWLRVLAALGVIAGMVVVVQVRGAPVLREHLQRASLLPIAELALYYGIDDPVAFAAATPLPEELSAVGELLRSLGHVPFDRVRDPALGDVLDLDRVDPASPSALRGRLEHSTPVAEGTNRIEGTLLLGDAEAEQLLLLAPDGRVVGDLVVVGPPFERPAAEADGSPAARRRLFVGYVRSGAEETEMRPFARAKGELRFGPLLPGPGNTAP